MPPQESSNASALSADGRTSSPESGSAQGFIKLSRKYLGSEEWLSGETFSSREAWIDIISLANWGAWSRTTSAGTLLVLQRGQFSASVRFLSSRWGWSKGAVERFMAKLVRENRIQRAENTPSFDPCKPGHQPGHQPGHPKRGDLGHIPIVYVIVKYDYYQGSTDKSGTARMRDFGTPNETPTEPKVREGKKLQEEKQLEQHGGSADTQALPAGAGVSVPESMWSAWAENADSAIDVVGTIVGCIEPSPERDMPADEAKQPSEGTVLMLPLIASVEPTVPSAKPKGGFPPAFERLWAAYPKRAGGNPKKGAFAKWKATQRRGASVAQLQRAAEVYALHCRGKSKAARFIEFTGYVSQAETFFGPTEKWRDWLTPATAAPTPPPAQEVAGLWELIDRTATF